MTDLFGEAAAHDPGGKVRLAAMPGVRGDAVFCGRDGFPGDTHRPLLWREWGLTGAPYALFIGMNPSVAGAQVDDPTVRREVIRTMGWGLTGYRKCNVADYRSTDPKGLRFEAVLSSPLNLPTIIEQAAGADRVVLAFGRLEPPMKLLAADMVAALRARGIALLCLGANGDGSPKHPLYLRGDAPVVPWAGWRERAAY